MFLANSMEGKFPSKILVFVIAITHNCDSFFCWSQIFHILPSICKGFILPSQIRYFERAFWVRQKFLVANRHFFLVVYVYFRESTLLDRTYIYIYIERERERERE